MSSSLNEVATPAEVKDAKGIHLITTNTPNGQKTQILLEELKELYGTEWTTTLLNLRTGVQKNDWFLRLNPNGRIPVIVDNNRSPPFPVMESSAELLYLQATYDTNHELSFQDPLERSQALQWLFFWHGSGAPFIGQYAHFVRTAKENVPYAIERYKNESIRVLGVLETHLSGKYTTEPRDYLAGSGKGKYSIADIGTWPWIKELKTDAWQEGLESFPYLVKYIDRIAERSAVRKGIGKNYEQ